MYRKGEKIVRKRLHNLDHLQSKGQVPLIDNKNKKKDFCFVLSSLNRTFELKLESRLHLGKTQIYLVFLSVCTTFEPTARRHFRSEMLK